MEPAPKPAREWIARAFTVVEDVVYVGLGLLLAALVLTLLGVAAVDLVRSLISSPERASVMSVVGLLDRILLVLLIVELLYTVQVSFRAHMLAPEPFLLVGLISAIRRVLLLTTTLGEQHDRPQGSSDMLILELGVLAGLILVLSISLVLLRRVRRPVVAKRA